MGPTLRRIGSFGRFSKNAGLNVIKLFTAVNYDYSEYALVYAPGKLFHPCLMFVDNARSLSEGNLKSATLGQAPALPTVILEKLN